MAIETVLFQSGYLTITESLRKFGRLYYRLSYPNFEVKTSLTDYVLENYTASILDKELTQNKLMEVLQTGEIESIKDIMHAHFASIPNEWYRKNNIAKYEGYYASVFYSYFASIGVDIRVEDATNKGKVDMAVLMPYKVLIFEFKVVNIVKDTTPALEQIKNKGYAEKYKSLKMPIYLVGIEFDRVEKNIVNFQVETLML